MKKSWSVIAIFFLFFSVEKLHLMISGQKTFASYTSKRTIGTRSPSYDIHYHFTAEDKTTAYGSAIGGKGGKGYLNIRYLKADPSVNAPDLLWYMIIKFLLWFTPGMVFVYLSLRGIIPHKSSIRQGGLLKLFKSFLLFCLIITLSVFLYAGYYFYISIKPFSGYSLDTGQGVSRGNTHGNVINNSLMTEDQTHLYFVNWEDGNTIYRMNKDGSMRLRIVDRVASNLNVTEKYLFYSDFHDRNRINRVDKSGRKRITLNDSDAGNITVRGEWIYYAEKFGSQPGGICRIKTNGKGYRRLTNDKATCVNIEGEWIYYVNRIDNAIYRVKTNGQERTKLISGEAENPLLANSITDLIFVEDWLYYIEAGQIIKVLCDGTEKTRVGKIRTGNMNVHNGWIYYAPQNGMGIYRMKTDGSSEEKISNLQGSIGLINIAGGWLLTVDIYDLKMFLIRMP